VLVPASKRLDYLYQGKPPWRSLHNELLRLHEKSDLGESIVRLRNRLCDFILKQAKSAPPKPPKRGANVQNQQKPDCLRLVAEIGLLSHKLQLWDAALPWIKSYLPDKLFFDLGRCTAQMGREAMAGR
jgi:hypothetical protein